MKQVFKKFNMRLTGISILLCLSLFQVTLSQAQQKNLLFIMTDQQRYDAMSIAGNTVLETPNLDRLAAQGAYFKNAYTPCAVCGPARASILTGSSVESTGVYSNSQTYDYTGSEVMTMPTFDEVLSENGYRSEYYGKWHTLSSKASIYQNPVKYTSNDRYVFGGGGATYMYRDYLSENQAPVAQQEGQFLESISKFPYIPDPLDKYYGMTQAELDAQNLSHSQPDQNGQLLVDEGNSETAFVAKEVIEAIGRLKDQPFSLTCSFHFPHSPMTPTEPYYGMYPPDGMPMPASIGDDLENSPYSNSKTKALYSDPEKVKYLISNYYGLINEIDVWVGKILEKLEEEGIADNTLIIFTSDHGEMLGAHGMREKNIFLEESAHIPLLISSPGDVEAGTTVDGYVSLIDLFPTILDYLEVPEKKSDGKSLRGLIEGTDTEHGQYAVTEWDRDNSPNYMIVKDGWKLFIPYTIKSTVINAMYDLNTDPHETNNLLGSNPNRAQYQDKAEELRASLLEWLAEKNSVHYYSVSQRDLLNGGGPTGNNAAFVSQNLPEFVKGETVSVSITMKNTGTTTWTPEGHFKLASQSPAENTIWGLDHISLSEGESIAPNEEKTFTFDITVPAFDGTYNFQWQMIQEGEEWFGSKSEIEQVIYGDPGSYLDECDSKTSWEKASLITLISSDHKQGAGCLQYTGAESSEFKKVFSTPYDPGVTEENAVLQFWYYISDISKFESSNQIELGSGAKNDLNEYNWKMPELSIGWNFISLKFSEAGNTGGDPDFNAINWFRIYHKKTGTVTSRLDAIQIIEENSLSIDDVVVEKEYVRVYPNPLSDDELTVDLRKFKELSNVEVSITNILGQTIYRKTTHNKEIIRINTSGLLKSSIYLVTVKSGKSIITTKLIVE